MRRVRGRRMPCSRIPGHGSHRPPRLPRKLDRSDHEDGGQDDETGPHRARPRTTPSSSKAHLRARDAQSAIARERRPSEGRRGAPKGPRGRRRTRAPRSGRGPPGEGSPPPRSAEPPTPGPRPPTGGGGGARRSRSRRSPARPGATRPGRRAAAHPRPHGGAGARPPPEREQARPPPGPPPAERGPPPLHRGLRPAGAGRGPGRVDRSSAGLSAVDRADARPQLGLARLGTRLDVAKRLERRAAP